MTRLILNVESQLPETKKLIEMITCQFGMGSQWDISSYTVNSGDSPTFLVFHTFQQFNKGQSQQKKLDRPPQL